MIVLNTNQLNHIGFKNKSNQRSTNFQSQFFEKVKHPNNVNDHSSEDTYSQKTVTQTSSLIVNAEHQQTGSNFFKQHLSLFATFAIKQYKTLANIETQQKKSSMLSISEYA